MGGRERKRTRERERSFLTNFTNTTTGYDMIEIYFDFPPHPARKQKWPCLALPLVQSHSRCLLLNCIACQNIPKGYLFFSPPKRQIVSSRSFILFTSCPGVTSHIHVNHAFCFYHSSFLVAMSFFSLDISRLDGAIAGPGSQRLLVVLFILILRCLYKYVKPS